MTLLLAAIMSLTPPVQEHASASTVRRLALHYDPVLAHEFDSPAIAARVGERRVWFLIDTGAGVHTLASWFVNATGLQRTDPFRGAVKGVDATARPVQFQWVEGVSATLEDGTDLRLDVAAVADFPPEFEKLGVAGALSPQLLAGAGLAAALDLRVPELRLEPFEPAVARLSARVQNADSARVCSPPEAPTRVMHFALRVGVGAEQAWLTLDTGANRTILRPESAAARALRGALEPAGHTTGITGVQTPVRVAKGTLVHLGDRQATVDVWVGATNTECGEDGRVGIDAVRPCAFVLSDAKVAMACDADRERRPAASGGR